VAENGPSGLSTLIGAPPITSWDVVNVQAGDVEPCPETAVRIGATHHFHVILICIKQHVISLTFHALLSLSRKNLHNKQEVTFLSVCSMITDVQLDNTGIHSAANETTTTQ